MFLAKKCVDKSFKTGTQKKVYLKEGDSTGAFSDVQLSGVLLPMGFKKAGMLVLFVSITTFIPLPTIGAVFEALSIAIQNRNKLLRLNVPESRDRSILARSSSCTLNLPSISVAA